MSLDGFPSEILERIFSKLSSDDLLSCEQVCRRWEVEVTAVREARWRRACVKDFPDAYSEARRKSKYKLSWQQLHRSLSLWPNIASARMTCYTSGLIDEVQGGTLSPATENPRQFSVLNNGLLAIPVYTEDEATKFRSSTGECDTVQYLEIDTLRNHHTLQYKFTFDTYEETDDIVVLRAKLDRDEDRNQLVIGVKEHGSVVKMFTVGPMKMYMWGDASNFTRVNNSVYYIDKTNVICVAKPTQSADGKTVIVSKPLLVWWDDERGRRVDFRIAAVAEVGEMVHVLTDRGQVYAAADRQYTYLGRVEKKIDNRVEVVDKLTAYGFEWSSPAVFRWLKEYDIIEGDWVAITRTKRAILHRQGRVVVLATIIRTVHIYHNPFNKRDGKLNLYNARPAKKVDLRDLLYVDENMPPEVKRVSQIDVVESVGGHKVIVLVAEMVVVLDFRHGDSTAPTEAKRPRVG